MSKILDLNMVSILCEELNKEINYKLSENEPALFNETGGSYLQFNSDGNDIRIYFFGGLLWSSDVEEKLENIPIETQMDLNERENFESHLRILIMDKINSLKTLEM